MAVAKIKIPVESTAITTVPSTWVKVAECTLPVLSCSFMISDIWLLAKGAGAQIGSFKAEHRGRAIIGSPVLTGSMTTLVSFSAGSGGLGGTYSFANARINISGSNLQLQVQPGVSVTTEWYGGFTLIVN